MAGISGFVAFRALFPVFLPPPGGFLWTLAACFASEGFTPPPRPNQKNPIGIKKYQGMRKESRKFGG
jgi:hypothetical protein